MPLDQFVAMAQSMAFNVTDFPRLLQLIHTNEDVKIIFATIGFRRLLSSEKNPPIQAVIDSNLVPRFIHFLSRADLPKL
jgi:hypothetical protein